METWTESVYSDGTADFVSDPAPKLGQTVRILIRFYADAPVRSVALRTVPNGADTLIPAKPVRTCRGLVYWQAELKMTEPRMQYQFYLATDRALYYYTQKGITDCLPDQSCDFVLMTDYVQPTWVRESVFYQIFPERFCNGDPDNDVRDGEYRVEGNPTIRVRDWSAPAMSYQQGHCLDFYGGDLQGIREKIPYLKDLGITALYLNPIFTAPSVHKYDCADYFHVDPHFGGDEALAELSWALHENGMRLILDISINHTGSGHRWFNRDGLYFPRQTGAYQNPESPERAYYFFGPGNQYKGWWGISSLPVLNYTSRALRDLIYRRADSVLRKWLRPPWSIDGWRFDVADVFARNDEIQLAHELWPEIRRAIREENPEAYILAEDWGDCAQYLQGTEWDSPMNYFGCGRVIRQFVGEQDFFLRRWPAAGSLPGRIDARSLRTRVLQHFARLPWAIQENQFNLIDSHDITRLHNNKAVDPGEYRGAVIFPFMLPGAASVYYGDEAAVGGEPGSNEGCRWTMPWGSGFEESERFRFYRTLIRLKRDHAALRRGGMKFLYAEGGLLAMARFAGDETFIFVMSTEAQERSFRLPLGAVGASRPEADRDVFGTALNWEPADGKAVRFAAAAHTAYLFRAV